MDYDPTKFYVGSTDKKGHSASIRINIPPEIQHRISEILASRKVKEFRTFNDLVRDALVHELGRLDAQGLETWTAEFSVFLALDEIEMLEALQQSTEKLITKLASTQMTPATLVIAKNAAKSLVEPYASRMRQAIEYWYPGES